jgi:RNA-splicing ligase RtcB
LETRTGIIPPHGAGRIMSRGKAFAELSMDDYRKAMEGIYSTSVRKTTLDESPMAYKSMNGIIANISPTARILKIVKPIYNYKASGNRVRKKAPRSAPRTQR